MSDHCGLFFFLNLQKLIRKSKSNPSTFTSVLKLQLLFAIDTLVLNMGIHSHLERENSTNVVIGVEGHHSIVITFQEINIVDEIHC